MEVTISGTEITVKFTEPTTNVNDTPLLDLDHTSVYTVINSEKTKVRDIPASALTGGGAVSDVFIIETEPLTEIDVEVQATASDIVGNESAAISQVIRIDKLPPKSPA